MMTTRSSSKSATNTAVVPVSEESPGRRYRFLAYVLKRVERNRKRDPHDAKYSAPGVGVFPLLLIAVIALGVQKLKELVSRE